MTALLLLIYQQGPFIKLNGPTTILLQFARNYERRCPYC